MMQKYPVKIGRKTFGIFLLENLTKWKVHDLDHLKEVLTTCWEQISPDPD